MTRPPLDSEALSPETHTAPLGGLDVSDRRIEAGAPDAAGAQPESPLPGAGSRMVVDIEDIAFGGEGVARVRDFVIFVPFVIAGERVEVEIIEVRRSFARARLIDVVRPSPHRVRPLCRHYGECGGCQYQHMDYPAQLKAKQKQVTDLFQRIGRFRLQAIEPVVPCPEPYGYRNRIMIRSQWDRPRQALNLGFIRHDNRLVVDVEECRIAAPELNEQLLQARNHPPPKGGLKVVLRSVPPGWEVPRDSFFQNNTSMLPRLVEAVRARVAHGGARRLVDAYCGVGFFAIELADQVERYVGIEMDRPAIQAARHNAAARGRLNGEFIAGDVAVELPRSLEQLTPSGTSVIIDPPRTGCSSATIQLLRECRASQIVYVSCHPATLARDLNALCQDGVYTVANVAPLDLFPQTQHVECVVDLRAGPFN